MQLGENEKRIFEIGSPDIDVMLSEELPSLEIAKDYYDIEFENYGIFMYHPVTTEISELAEHIATTIRALKQSGKNYVVIYPNNDLGTEIILKHIQELEEDKQFAIYPSIRFEYFLTLLKNADMIVGNSSAGIRESGIYGIPAIDIGTRQNGRYDIHQLKNIQHVSENEKEILKAIAKANDYKVVSSNFGNGNSTERFLEILKQDNVWNMNIQKQFIDLWGGLLSE